MNRMTKIITLAIGYAVIVFGAVKGFEINVIFDNNIWLEAFAWAGIAFAFGFLENILGFSIFNGWVNRED